MFCQETSEWVLSTLAKPGSCKHNSKQLSNLLIVETTRKPTLPPDGKWSMPSSQQATKAADQLLLESTSMAVFIIKDSHSTSHTLSHFLPFPLSIFLSPSLPPLFSLPSFGWLLYSGWEQTVSLLNNSHHFHLIFSYHGQFSSWIILWKIHLLWLRVMRQRWWQPRVLEGFKLRLWRGSRGR